MPESAFDDDDDDDDGSNFVFFFRYEVVGESEESGRGGKKI